jgi:hypothetical protein
MVAAIDKRDPGVSMSERLRCVESAESAADDDNVFHMPKLTLPARASFPFAPGEFRSHRDGFIIAMRGHV